MSFQLGAVPLILAMVAIVASFWRPARERALAWFFAGATLLVLLLMLPLSAPLWELLPVAALIQFPWRLLTLTAVTLAFLAGLAIPVPQPRFAPNGQVLVLALVAVLGSFAYTLPCPEEVLQTAWITTQHTRPTAIAQEARSN